MYSGKIPVKTGEHWFYKDSLLVCGNSLDNFERMHADLIYSDPPWNENILKSFYRWSNTTGPNFKELTTLLCQHMSETGAKNIWIEMGKKSSQLWIDLMLTHNYYLWDVIPCEYGNNGTYDLLWFQPIPVPTNINICNVTCTFPSKGMSGAVARIKSICVPGQTFYDPCAGEGYFILPALQSGMNIIGGELIPDKFSSMLTRLYKGGFQFIKEF